MTSTLSHRHVLRVGYPWGDMQGRYGKWTLVYAGFSRWPEQGVWDAMVQTLLDLELTADWKHRIDTRPPVTKDRTVLRELPQARLRPPMREASCRRDLAYVDHREFDIRRSSKAIVIRNSDLTAPFLKYRADELHVCIARLKGRQTGPRRMLGGKGGRERPPTTAL
ncbi:hypothetical protein PX699_27225 [Sphingobium sp. H39-3-25]|uniref:hypothetical protein n=1 Tax=Sphingobium arseniciresistens TaxID=3030834 RepID=UPI0023B9DBED|nr:hypothetical protein [Sphingobium arseniciresistens]